MGLFGHHDPADLDRLNDSGVRVQEQTVHVTTIERDNGVRSADTNSISSALHDLADRNSTTHTVRLPHGTTVKLASTVSPSIRSWRARFEITNGTDQPKIAVGVSKAADLAKEIDVIAMSSKDKKAIQAMSEAEDESLQEIEIHVSGYVTKKGKHVGAYSQIRKAIDNLGPGSTLHLPDGIAVKRTSGGYSVGTTSGIKKIGGAHRPNAKAAADDVARKSASLNHPKSIGGRVQHQIDKPTEINQIPNSGDNTKLPGAPDPADVADRAAKERARNEAIASIKKKVKRLKPGESIEVGTSRIRRVDLEPPMAPSGRKANVKGGTTFEVTGPGGRRGTGVWTSPELAAEEAHARDSKHANGRGRKSAPSPPEAENVRIAQEVAKLTPEGQKRYERFKGEGHDHAAALRGAKSSERRDRDESPMSGVIRRPSEVDAIRAKEGRASQDKASKSAAANIDREKRRASSSSGKEKTPGYNSRLKIWFDYDKNGRLRAYYWSYGRAIPLGRKKAEDFIDNKQADQLPGHPLKGPRG